MIITPEEIEFLAAVCHAAVVKVVTDAQTAAKYAAPGIGPQIVARRVAAGFSESALSGFAGIDYELLCAIEGEACLPSLEIVAKINAVYDNPTFISTLKKS